MKLPSTFSTFHQLLVLLTCSLFSTAIAAQEISDCPSDLEGIWSTELPTSSLFSFGVAIHLDPQGNGTAILTAGGFEETIAVQTRGQRLRFQSERASLAFEVEIDPKGTASGFLTSGRYLLHFPLQSQPAAPGASSWTTTVSLLGTAGSSFPLDLYIGAEDGSLGGWFFFRDQRLPSLYGLGVQCQEATQPTHLRLAEKNLDLRFSGHRDGPDLLNLDVTGPGGTFPVTFQRLSEDPMDSSHAKNPHPPYQEVPPPHLGDEWRTGLPSAAGFDPESLSRLVLAVSNGDLPNTHSVLIARHGELVFEQYFYGFDRETRHDLRSASKTVTSMLIGAAIDADRLPGTDVQALPYFPRYRQLANWDPRKAQITLHHLLTMSSGLDADDSRQDSVAAEDNYQSQSEQPDWMRFVLDAPMIEDPGVVSRYGTANPLLLGGILHQALGGSEEWFAHQRLFGPLAISNYHWQVDPTGIVYQGGGLYLQPRDLAKLGQMVLDKGIWNGRRVLAESWIQQSTQKYGPLQNVGGKNQYGYLWWHHSYPVGDQEIDSIEARGNGGQYLFVLPALDTVVVINSGNYRNRDLLQQPELILEHYLLPALTP